ncbi:uncharacterized protein PgNI_07825 [Pyricularia grisea]|uniref:Nephrocystin 3-like N-terminal domain-containing protein n=1 Tax=Pyricularia grisea TaxID=148305 RepID=A0A6P8B2G5_PYRGI|nr:uncharacterized protein PgNI_07825 [Pyricularia grisea]TLD09057.1 hypothetical protein PgNI_07825 [Pyricularia grisea]
MAEITVLDSPNHYTIGWIAALPIEAAAAAAIFDEEHGPPKEFVRHSTDENSYDWGRMGEHNIVIASLPAGRVGIMVGIGSGIARPNEGRDIRFGDIVVSQPYGTTGGVCQYDLVKAKSGDVRQRQGFLAAPPAVFLHALGAVRRFHERKPSKIPQILEKMLSDNPKMAESTKAGIVQDATLPRKSNEKNETRRAHESSTASLLPATHSSKTPSPATRFWLTSRRTAFALIWRLRGLMNDFPCVVVRDICDYADSHKNDRWQRYAFVTAAAYAKELLSYVPAREVSKSKRALEILESVQDHFNVVREAIGSLVSNEQVEKIKSWLSPADPSADLNKAQKKRHPGTGDWLLEGSSFRGWKSDPSGRLLIFGLSGRGKTVLESSIITRLKSEVDIPRTTLYFFFGFDDKGKKTVDQLVLSFLFQLYDQVNCSRDVLDSALKSSEHGELSTEQLSTILKNMMQASKQTIYVVLDALDECSPRTNIITYRVGLFSISILWKAADKITDDPVNKAAPWVCI